MVADPTSFWRFRRLDDPERRWNPGETVELRFRELGPAPVRVRPRTADVFVARDVFLKRHHLPPAELDPSSIGVVWDLGANIGFTMRHIAAVCRRARIVGVELDEDNARLCVANTAALGARCSVIRAAVWTSDGEVSYDREGADEQSFRVDDAPAARPAKAPAISLDALLRRTGVERIDYVKMDIEGAERHVLREATAWAHAVRSIKVEVHPPYTVDECERDLRRLGLETARLSKRRGGVAGIRR